MSNSAFTVTGTSTGGGTGTVTEVDTGTGLSGGPITSTGTISIANTAVTAGSYTNSDITVNAQGQITSASSGSGGGTVTSVTAGTGLTSTPNPITTTGTISLVTPVSVTDGGTGGATFNPYAVVCGGTISTDPLQSLSMNGTVNQVLTSGGPGVLPSWQTAPFPSGAPVQIQNYLQSTTESLSLPNYGASVAFVNSAFTAAITPNGSSNGIILQLNLAIGRLGTTYPLFVRFVRNVGAGDVIIGGNTAPGLATAVTGTIYPNGASDNVYPALNMGLFTFMDFPSTTSAITYKFQLGTTDASGGSKVVWLNTFLTPAGNNVPAGISTWTLTEVQS